jgi:hypothetical protein
MRTPPRSRNQTNARHRTRPYTPRTNGKAERNNVLGLRACLDQPLNSPARTAHARGGVDRLA